MHSCQWRPQLWEYVCFRILDLTFPKYCKGRRQTPAELFADACCTVYLWWQKRMWTYCMIMSYYNHRYVDRYVYIRQLERWCCARSRLTIAPTLMRNSTRSCGHVICWHLKGCETMTELCKGSRYLVGITLLEEFIGKVQWNPEPISRMFHSFNLFLDFFRRSSRCFPIKDRCQLPDLCGCRRGPRGRRGAVKHLWVFGCYTWYLHA